MTALRHSDSRSHTTVRGTGFSRHRNGFSGAAARNLTFRRVASQSSLTELAGHRLVVFLTRRMSFAKWDRLGIIDRELAIYRTLHDQGLDVSFVSYGTNEEQNYVSRYSWLRLAWNRWHLPRRCYERLLPWLYHDLLSHATWIKSNQTEGSDIALRAARRHNKPFLCRSGFVWSATEARRHGRDSRAARRAAEVESNVFPHADRLIVTTNTMRQQLVGRWSHLAPCIDIIPNYVDTEQFVPAVRRDPEFDLVYVGRMSKEKNLSAMLRAAATCDLSVLLVGKADRPSDWAAKVRAYPHRIEWIPGTPHATLPTQLRRGRVFIFPTYGEGHPKALLEALACGLPTIATAVPGVQELVTHDQTAWLCGTDESSLRRAMEHVVPRWREYQRLGCAGAKLVARHYSLSHVARLEAVSLLNATQGA